MFRKNVYNVNRVAVMPRFELLEGIVKFDPILLALGELEQKPDLRNSTSLRLVGVKEDIIDRIPEKWPHIYKILGRSCAGL